MALLEHNDPILHKLNDQLTASAPRHYLGLSQIGKKCHRQLQFYHYWAHNTSLSARLLRLFEVGHNAEAGMIADLAKVGITVSGEQAEIIGTAGHWKGHIDGEGLQDGDPEPFLVEFKTHNDKSFKDLKKNKVKKSKPEHYDQMQSYMGYRGYSKALYMALSKNTSEYYIEWVEFDPDHFNDLKRKEFEIIVSDTLLPRIGNGSKTWFECKLCDSKHVCFGAPIIKSCRTCTRVDVVEGGKWQCDGKDLTLDEQAAGCDRYNLSEMFKEL